MKSKTKRRIIEDVYMVGTLFFAGRLTCVIAAACLKVLGVG